MNWKSHATRVILYCLWNISQKIDPMSTCGVGWATWGSCFVYKYVKGEREGEPRACACMRVCVWLPKGSMDARIGVQILDILGATWLPKMDLGHARQLVLPSYGYCCCLLPLKGCRAKQKLCAQEINKKNKEKENN